MPGIGVNPTLQLPQNLTVQREKNPWICCSSGITVNIDDHRTMIDPNARIVPDKDALQEADAKRGLIARCCSCFFRGCLKTGRKDALVHNILKDGFAKKYNTDIAEQLFKDLTGPITRGDLDRLEQAAKLLRDLQTTQEIPSTKISPLVNKSRSPSPTAADTKNFIKSISQDSIDFTSKQDEESPPQIFKSSSSTLIDLSPNDPPKIEIITKNYQGLYVPAVYERAKIEQAIKKLADVDPTNIPELVHSFEQTLPKEGCLRSSDIQKKLISALRDKHVTLKPIQPLSPLRTRSGSITSESQKVRKSSITSHFRPSSLTPPKGSTDGSNINDATSSVKSSSFLAFIRRPAEAKTSTPPPQPNSSTNSIPGSNSSPGGILMNTINQIRIPTPPINPETQNELNLSNHSKDVIRSSTPITLKAPPNSSASSYSALPNLDV